MGRIQIISFILMIIQATFVLGRAGAQEVASESLSFQCTKKNKKIEVRIEKYGSSCRVQRISNGKKRKKFEDKVSTKACDSAFYGEIKSLKKLGYNCD